MTRRLAVALALLTLLALSSPAAAAPLRLWHAYQAEERAALETVVATWKGEPIEMLALPAESYFSKLSAAIPIGAGPDLFIDAHNRIGENRARGLIAPVGDALEDDASFEPQALAAVRASGETWAVPISQKSVALFLNTDLLAEAPPTFEELAALAPRGKLPPGVFSIAYETSSAYPHAAFLHAFGARYLEPDDSFGFVGDAPARSLELVRREIVAGGIPEDADDALVKTLFESGKAASAISGPWMLGDLRSVPFHWRVVPLPTIASTGQPMRPFLTVESIYLTPSGAKRADARALARLLASADAARTRARLTHTPSARADVAAPADDATLAAFIAQARVAVPMPSSRAMDAVWEPAKRAIRKVLSGEMEAAPALVEARHRFDDVMRPPPQRASPAPLAIALGAIALVGALLLVRRARRGDFALRRSLPAYKYLLHAVLAVGVLVVLPLAIGAATAFTAGRSDELRYVGLANFIQILTARGEGLLTTGSFYVVLLVTVLWTVVNVFFHVAIGVALGLLLSRPAMKLRAVYRVLLILPWAVPSYVTALAWKGMFHRQFGAVTGLLLAANRLFGTEIQPLSWFSRFSTAFAANVATNVWLGFPFMMVVTLGALTAVPEDVLEAAAVDGATRWQRLTRVTLPLIRPTLAPAVTLGAIWTFNMFNVVFLVSGGDPDGQTEILVSDAYRWAFTRNAQYGYAAAYAVLIFLLLTGVTRLDTWRRALRDRQASAALVAGDAALHAKGAA